MYALRCSDEICMAWSGSCSTSLYSNGAETMPVSGFAGTGLSRLCSETGRRPAEVVDALPCPPWRKALA